MVRRLRPWCLHALSATVVACGGDQAPADGGAPDAGAAIATPPEIPWLAAGAPPVAPPMLTPCPAGWREVADEAGVTVCDPEPMGGAPDCPFGQALFPGDAACAPIGDPCPPSDYAADLPTDGSVRYVSARAGPGGDGSLAAPHASLDEVPWSVLSAGATVAIAKGTYAGTLPLRAGVRVVGACAAETIVTNAGRPATAAVEVLSGGAPAVVRNLAIRDTPYRGVYVDAGRALELEGVSITRAHMIGAQVTGAATLTLRSTVIEETLPEAGDFGGGIDASAGSRLDASRLLVRQTHVAGVLALGAGTTVTLADAAIVDGLPREADDRAGRGLSAQDGARVEGARILVSNSREDGVYAAGAGTAIELVDAIVRDTQPQARTGTLGQGLFADDGASITATRVLVSGNHHLGGVSHLPGSLLTLTDAVVRDTLPQHSDGLFGRGLNADFGARIVATRALLARNHEVGVMAVSAGTNVALTDTVIRDTRSIAGGELARAIDLEAGATVEVSRMIASHNDEGGCVADGEGTVLRVTDVAILGGGGGPVARGLTAQLGARVEATRTLIDGARELGVGCHEGTVSLIDAIVRDTDPRGGDLAFGYGIAVQTRGELIGERIIVESAHEVGFLAFDGAISNVRDVAIRNVERSSCACPDRVYGFGVAAIDGGTMRIERFEVVDAATCGLIVSGSPVDVPATALDAAFGRVEGASIGACIQVDGYDVDRLTREVVYRDNGTSLDSTALPVPDGVAPLGAP